MFWHQNRVSAKMEGNLFGRKNCPISALFIRKPGEEIKLVWVKANHVNPTNEEIDAHILKRWSSVLKAIGEYD